MATRRTPSSEIVSDLLAGALEVLTSNGPDGFTVRAIAKQARIAPMAIYNHFGSLNGLIEAFWIEGFDLLSEAVAVNTGNAASDLMQSGNNYRKFALAYRGHYTIMFMHHFKNFEPSSQAEQHAARAFGELVNLVLRAQGAKEIQDGSASDIAQTVWSACHGFVSLELLSINFSTNPDASYQNLLTTLFKGLKR